MAIQQRSQLKGFGQSTNEKYIVEDIHDIVTEVNSKPYKVYTALLTQIGGSDVQTITNGDLTIGVTYYILNEGGDWTNVGAPNNNLGTYFVATGTTPNTWNGGSLRYNLGAPVVTVLENTLGNVWFTYNESGTYYINSNGLFIQNKTYHNPTNYNLPNDITEGYSLTIQNSSAALFLAFQDNILHNDSLQNTPIEIRVYN